MPNRAPIFTTRSTLNARAAGEKFRSQRSTERYDSTWRKVRRIKLQSNPLCEPCEREGRITEATMVHHIKPVEVRPDLRLVLSNLQSICLPCHGKAHAGHPHPIVNTTV